MRFRKSHAADKFVAAGDKRKTTAAMEYSYTVPL